MGAARRPKSVRPAPQLYSAEHQPYQYLDIGDALAKSRKTLLSENSVDARRQCDRRQRPSLPCTPLLSSASRPAIVSDASRQMPSCSRFAWLARSSLSWEVWMGISLGSLPP
jgi:hypothetical protein